jgi:hypothetical protein
MQGIGFFAKEFKCLLKLRFHIQELNNIQKLMPIMHKLIFSNVLKEN